MWPHGSSRRGELNSVGGQRSFQRLLPHAERLVELGVGERQRREHADAVRVDARLQQQQAVAARLLDDRDALLADFAAHQPKARSYSPLGFDANFLCNTVVAMVATALGEPGPHPSLNALFTRLPSGDATPDEAERHARALMRYAVGNRVSSEAPLITYDSCEAAHAFNVTSSVLRETQRFAVGSA